MCRPEQAIQHAVCEHLRRRAQTNVYWCAVPIGGYRRPIEAAIMRGCRVVPGTPDLILIRNGFIYGLEIKAPGGRLSEAQRGAHEAPRNAGATGAVAYGIDAAIKQLEDWHLLRGRAQ
jgi:hypothetical protein